MMKELVAALMLASASGGFATPEQEACAAAFMVDTATLPSGVTIEFEQVHRHVTMSFIGTNQVVHCRFRELHQSIPELESVSFSLGDYDLPDEPPNKLDEFNENIWQHFSP